MKDYSSREQIEQDIITAFDRVIRTINIDDPSWLESEEMDEFLDLWPLLVSYYARSGDTVISVAVVREYVHMLRLAREFQTMELEPSSGVLITPKTKKRAGEIVGTLEWAMDNIIKEVKRTLNNSS